MSDGEDIIASGSSHITSDDSEESAGKPIVDVEEGVLAAAAEPESEEEVHAEACGVAVAAAPPPEMATLQDVVRQLTIAKGRGKLAQAIAYFHGKVTKGEPIGHPKSMAHKYLTDEVIKAAAAEVGN